MRTRSRHAIPPRVGHTAIRRQSTHDPPSAASSLNAVNLNPTNLGLIATLGIGIAVPLVRWPALGPLLATAILYLNLLPILIRHGVSPAIVAAPAALVASGLLKHWLVDHKSVVVDRPFLMMFAFLACTVVSGLLANVPDAVATWLFRFVVEGLLVYFAVLNLFHTSDSIHRLTWVLILCGAFLASLALYQEMTGARTQFGGLATRATAEDLPLEEYDRSERSVVRDANRAAGPELDANRFAQILIVLLPLAWCLMRGENRMAAKVLAGVCASLILGGVLVTYSRTAFLGLVMMLFLMGIIRLATFRQILGAVMALMLAITVFSPGYRGRMATLVGLEGLVRTTAAEREPDSTQRGRAALMLSAWKTFLERPVFGCGPGQFAAVHVIDYQGEMYQLRFRRDTLHFRTHSLYLELAAETGVIGFTAFMAIVIVTLRRLAVARRKGRTGDRFVGDAAGALMVAIGAYLTTGLFSHMTYQRYYWLLLGLAGATVRVAGSSSVGTGGGPRMSDPSGCAKPAVTA